MAKSKKHKKEKKSKKKKSHKEKHKKNSKNVDKKLTKTVIEKSKPEETATTTTTADDNYAIPLDLMCNKSHAPETPEEYQKRQNKLRHEIDPVTGRKRLIRGDGEILEEIVSRKRHVEINKFATKEDGRFFQQNTTG